MVRSDCDSFVVIGIWISPLIVDNSLLLKIADINLTSEAKVKLEPGINLPFTYQVRVV